MVMLDLPLNLDHIVPSSRHFRWSELLLLKRRGYWVFPDAAQHRNLIELVQVLEKIRSLFNSRMHITSGLRTSDYNREIGGARHSLHMMGFAADFWIEGYEGVAGCNMVRQILYPKLEEFRIRMENKNDAGWVHIDLGEPRNNSSRFFYP